MLDPEILPSRGTPTSPYGNNHTRRGHWELLQEVQVQIYRKKCLFEVCHRNLNEHESKERGKSFYPHVVGSRGSDLKKKRISSSQAMLSALWVKDEGQEFHGARGDVGGPPTPEQLLCSG